MSGFAHDVQTKSQQRVAPVLPSINLPLSNNPQINILRGRKRPREPDSNDGNPKEPLIIWPYPCSLTDTSIKAWPQFLLPRVRLPLSYLDPYTTAQSVVRTRFVTSKSRIPELQDDDDSLIGPRVLVAKLDLDSAFYAVEKVDDAVFSICKLSNWIVPETLQAFGGRTSKLPAPNVSLPKNNVKAWWSHAALENSSTESESSSEKKMLYCSIGSYAESEVVVPPLTMDHEVQSVQQDILEEDELTSKETQTLEMGSAFEEIYSNITKQYLDILYLSKTSLAYFAKGPLSRARAMCSTTQREDVNQATLAEFLRSQVIGISTLDKKYKESISAVVKTLMTVPQNGDDIAQYPSAKLYKRRKVNKFKPGKDGLFPGETEIISRWWIKNDSDLVSTVSVGTSLTTRLTSLKLRETLLQLIVMLEVLAVETSTTASRFPQAEDHVTMVEAMVDPSAIPSKSARMRRPADFHSLIDSLVDRLSIWQSIETAASTIENESEIQGPSDGASASGIESTSPLDSDHLKDFYTEVLIPFYAARLPDLVQKLAGSFGVVTGRSPSQRRIKKPRTLDDVVATGSEKMSGRSVKTRKTLSRTATDNARPAAQPPSLIRSATDSLVEGIKREKSATSRVSFDFKENRRPLSRSSSISQSKMLTQREVDFGFISKFNESKARRKITVEEELQEAILTLKKPNRGLAVKEFVDAADSRKLASRSDRTTNMSHRHPNSGVQVIATPHRLKKTKDVISSIATQSPDQALAGSKESIPSSNPWIPSSAIRPLPQATPRTGSRLPILETPTRVNQKFSQLHLEPQLAFDDATSSCMSKVGTSDFKVPQRNSNSRTVTEDSKRKGLVANQLMTPVKIRPQVQVEATDAESHAVETPIRKLGFQSLQEVPMVPRNNTGLKIDGPSSIYESLGWNDGDDSVV